MKRSRLRGFVYGSAGRLTLRRLFRFLTTLSQAKFAPLVAKLRMKRALVGDRRDGEMFFNELLVNEYNRYGEFVASKQWIPIARKWFNI